jgi:hypothetical protein
MQAGVWRATGARARVAARLGRWYRPWDPGRAHRRGVLVYWMETPERLDVVLYTRSLNGFRYSGQRQACRVCARDGASRSGGSQNRCGAEDFRAHCHGGLMRRNKRRALVASLIRVGCCACAPWTGAPATPRSVRSAQEAILIADPVAGPSHSARRGWHHCQVVSQAVV